jgi:hypothetical protein
MTDTHHSEVREVDNAAGKPTTGPDVSLAAPIAATVIRAGSFTASTIPSVEKIVNALAKLATIRTKP